MKAKVTKRGKAKWPRRLCDICGYDLAGDGSCSSLCDELKAARSEIERLKELKLSTLRAKLAIAEARARSPEEEAIWVELKREMSTLRSRLKLAISSITELDALVGRKWVSRETEAVLTKLREGVE